MELLVERAVKGVLIATSDFLPRHVNSQKNRE
jgi:hypothetical protein